MTLWGALAGGFVGALVVVLGSDIAVSTRLTRFDIPLLLGTALSRGRIAARALGYGVHLLLGLAFAAVYAAAGVSGWGEGALAGLAHGAIAILVLFPVALPLAHPRMALRGTTGRAPDRAMVQAPGSLTLAYGRWTPALLLPLHVLYGTIVGGFAGWSG
jgi:hypothetical protein